MNHQELNYCPVCGSTDIEIFSDDEEPYVRGQGPVVEIYCNNCNCDSKLIVREVKEHRHCPVCNKRTCLILGRHYCSECKLIFEDSDVSGVIL